MNLVDPAQNYLSLSLIMYCYCILITLNLSPHLPSPHLSQCFSVETKELSPGIASKRPGVRSQPDDPMGVGDGTTTVDIRGNDILPLQFRKKIISHYKDP